MNVIVNVKKLFKFFVIDGKGGWVSARYFKMGEGGTHLRAIDWYQMGGGGQAWDLSEEAG